MFTIIETLWRLLVLTACAFIQAGAAILGGIALVFGKGSDILRKCSGRTLGKLNHGRYEAKMRDIASK